jgi:hypothetical protein
MFHAVEHRKFPKKYNLGEQCPTLMTDWIANTGHPPAPREVMEKYWAPPPAFSVVTEEIPIPDFVLVRHRNGQESKYASTATVYDWSLLGKDTDILAYRIIRQG